MTRNNVTRLLEAQGIPFKAHELPAEKLTALEAAQILGVDPGLVFKTIVVLREGPARLILAVIPGPLEVDLKKLARVMGEKKLVLATQRQAEQVTGLQVGGISPLALIGRGFDIIADTLVKLNDEVYVSGGQRGLIIQLAVEALVKLTSARLADITG